MTNLLTENENIYNIGQGTKTDKGGLYENILSIDSLNMTIAFQVISIWFSCR